MQQNYRQRLHEPARENPNGKSPETNSKPIPFMNKEQYEFFTLRILPLRLHAKQTAWLLGCSEADIPVLVGHGLLTPIGKPSKNSMKYFSTSQIRSLGENLIWLNMATQALNEHWREKNAGRIKGTESV